MKRFLLVQIINLTNIDILSRTLIVKRILIWIIMKKQKLVKWNGKHTKTACHLFVSII